MKKNEIYVVIDTPKKAKKVKKLLYMFGENYAEYPPNVENHSGIEPNWYYGFCGNKWQGINTRHVSFKGNYPTEVSIKELKQILAFEHLKEGDVVFVKNNSGKWIVKLTGNDIDRFEHSASYNLDLGLLKDKKLTERHNKIYGASFIRYATEEEKALLEEKPKLEAGKWYTFAWNDKPDEIRGIYFIEKVEDIKVWFSYGIDLVRDEWKTKDWHSLHNVWKEATKEEVEQALIKEAKKRGYADGVKVNSFVHNRILQINKSKKEIKFIDHKNKLHFGYDGYYYVVVFENGKWAEIVEPTFVESSDKIKMAGEDIGKRVRVIDGGSGATGCNGETGIIVEKPKKYYDGSLMPVIYVKLDNGSTWGLGITHKLEYLTESAPLSVTIETKDISVIEQLHDLLLDVYGYSLDYKLLRDARELAQKLTKLI